MKAYVRPTRYGRISRTRRSSAPNSTKNPTPLYRYVLFPKYPGRTIKSNAKYKRPNIDIAWSNFEPNSQEPIYPIRTYFVAPHPEQR